MSSGDSTPPKKPSSWADIARKSLTPPVSSVAKDSLPVPPPPSVEPTSTPKPASVSSASATSKCSYESLQERGYPLGFNDKKQFEKVMQSLCETVTKLGIRCDEVGVRGSSATYYSKNPDKPGKYFDRDAPDDKSDIDVFFVTDSPLKCRPNKKGFFRPGYVKRAYPELARWNIDAKRGLGRKVTAAAFKSTAPAMSEEKITYSCR